MPENQFAKIHVYSRFNTFRSSRLVDTVAFGLPLNNFLLFSFLSWFCTRTSIHSNKKFERRVDILVCLEYGMLKRDKQTGMSVLLFELTTKETKNTKIENIKDLFFYLSAVLCELCGKNYLVPALPG